MTRTSTARPEGRDEARLPARDLTRTRVRTRKHGADEFWVDETKIPHGQSWEWKRFETYGAPDRSNELAMAQQGWEPVDASVFGDGRSGPVEVRGMRLYERPMELTEEARAEDRAVAAEQFAISSRNFGNDIPAENRTPQAAARTGIKRTIGPLEVAE